MASTRQKPAASTQDTTTVVADEAPAADETAAPPSAVTRPAPVAPSFGMCEGTRADLEQVEKTTDPFTGRTVTRGDLS